MQRRVVDKARALAKGPRPPGCVRVKGAVDLWRVRVGDYRLVYTIRDGELLVLVLSVAHRSEVYRDL
ncbi:type II toxin-antitoxin system RelE/ParE family toxin [Nocardiopsis exhalans]|uniref:Type II toxin-antitoxin system RelE/ParE family toxin n=1 Tax=Nocardiopsis exhalans TaxID=163604 RepID=A0ABY5D8X0_9ACTN|nr:type II toxin-antitoxin system RelE/ParE family toxin [Nocardiopsis exhalans]